VSLGRRPAATYAKIWRTYREWAPSILPLAAIVFLPLGLLDALTVDVKLDSLNLLDGVKVAALLVAIGAVTATGLIGEVFFSGAIALSLAHGDRESAPSLREIAARLNFGRLIAVDLAFVAIVSVGLLLGVLPGVLAFVWLGLAGPVVELEGQTAKGALRRSLQLVRGNFWLVFWVLVPIEIAGEGIGELLAAAVHGALGETFLATWLTEAATNIVLSPVFALAAVLLALELIEPRDRPGPAVDSAPVPA
jgi:hypothetical protein